MPHVGLLFLDDLYAFAPWIHDEASAWVRARRLAGTLMEPRVEPPPVVVVVARMRDGERPLKNSMDWLRLASRVVLVIDHSDSEADVQAELRQLRRQMEGVEVGEEGLESAIDRALVIGAASPAAPWPALETVVPRDAVSPGPWIDWSPRVQCGTTTVADAMYALGATSCWPGGTPAVLDVGGGTTIDLVTGERATVATHGAEADVWPPAISADGWSWLRPTERRGTGWAIHDGRTTRACPGGWGQPIGLDPAGRFAWTGGRCMFDWRVLTEAVPVYWTPSNHDWPCGHGKKLYGYEDNDPVAVHLSATGSGCLSIYHHDTLVTPGLPLRWRDVGGFALAERTRGEPRALLFERTDDDQAYPADPLQAEEDARDRFAVATIGPSPAQRYTVGLAATTYRLAGGAVERLGGPEPAWLVCDDQHRTVRRGTGRLLAGWDRWVIIEEHDRLRREDLVADTRTDLGAVARPIAGAAALPGSPNVVLISLVGTPAIRVV